MENMAMLSTDMDNSSDKTLLVSETDSSSLHTPSTVSRTMNQFKFGQDHYSENAMLFVVISATMGTISSFCASATVKLVTTQIQSFGESAGPWILLAIFLVAVFSSMHFLNRGLESGQALMVVPGFHPQHHASHDLLPSVSAYIHLSFANGNSIFHQWHDFCWTWGHGDALEGNEVRPRPA